MNETILVPLERGARLSQIVPLLDPLIKPDRRVIFLVRCPAGRWSSLQARLTAIQTGNMSAIDYSESEWRRDLRETQRRAEEQLAGAAQVMGGRKIDAEVKIYTGSLKRALASLTHKNTSRIIVLPAKQSLFRFRFVRRILSLFGLCHGRDIPAFLLLGPEQKTGI